jgi:hypothetical protein
MESTPSYFYFIYTPRGYKLQINNSSVLMFVIDGPPFPVIISGRIPGSGEGKVLRSFVRKRIAI